jgi:hypothetical protein
MPVINTTTVKPQQRPKTPPPIAGKRATTPQPVVRESPKTPQTAVREPRHTIRWRYVAYAIGGAVAITACNAISVIGQYRFAHTALASGGMPAQILFSVGCEAVALFFAASALISDLEDSPSRVFKCLSFAAGIGIGILNYSHDPGTALGITFGTFSVLSPQLWDVLGRILARPALVRSGAVQPREHGIRLGARRWILNPPRALSIIYHDAWSGMSGDKDVRKAIADHTARKAMNRFDTELEEIRS